MRPLASFALFCFILTFFGGNTVQAAIPEETVQERREAVELLVEEDVSLLEGAECGGLLNRFDERALAYFDRQPELHCTLTEWCEGFDEDGFCIGQRCDITTFTDQFGQEGVHELLSFCRQADRCELGDDASCTSCVNAVPSPRRNCSDNRVEDARYRLYSCERRRSGMSDRLSMNSAKAHCYSIVPELQSPFSFTPGAYNCRMEYHVSPLAPNRPDDDEPKGQPSLTVPQSPASITAIVSSSRNNHIALDTKTFDVREAFVHPRLSTLGQFFFAPDVSDQLLRLLHPPDVRLVLPSSFADRGQVPFSSSFLERNRNDVRTPVVQELGSNPDALRITAEYLKQVPLIEVEYVPLNIRAPHVPLVTLQLLIEEWKRRKEEIAALDGSSNTQDAIEEFLVVLETYKDLSDIITDYQHIFPEYLDTLLSSIEEANDFLRDNWIDLNVERLDGWTAAYESYLPELQTALHELNTIGTEFTHDCLVPSCRMEVIPVSDDAQPFDLLPGVVSFDTDDGVDDDLSTEFFLSDTSRAFKEEGFPLWKRLSSIPSSPSEEDILENLLLWHPPFDLSDPLPDLTIDLSRLLVQHKPVRVFVPQFELHPLNIPFPPELRDGDPAGSLARVDGALIDLPEFTAPDIDLSLPTFTLPDPETSLFLVPEPPRALDHWRDVVTAYANHLTRLLSTSDGICTDDDEPTTFLVHESRINAAEQSDPAEFPAVQLVPSPRDRRSFFNEQPSPAFPDSHLASFDTRPGSKGPKLERALDCPACSTARPQRYVRQHAQFEWQWEQAQEKLLHAVDHWNAHIAFVSVIPRDELVRTDQEHHRHSEMFKGLFTTPPF